MHVLVTYKNEDQIFKKCKREIGPNISPIVSVWGFFPMLKGIELYYSSR